MSLPVRGAWIEMMKLFNAPKPNSSLPVRGAWIEIFSRSDSVMYSVVAPRAGSVD